jgi:LIM and senescent cell antigen-like-containing domain protein 1/2
VFQALGKTWCVKCFSCSLCDKKMDQKLVQSFYCFIFKLKSILHRTKFYEFDMKPTCKKCYDRFPTELKKRISDNLREREADTMRRRSASPSTTQHHHQKSKSPGK